MAFRPRFAMLVLVFAYLSNVAFGSLPVVTFAQLSVQGQLRHVRINYTAEEKPLILWKTSDFITHLDNSTNSFSGNQGQATLTMYIHPRYDYLDGTLAAEIYSDCYHVSLNFRKGDIRLREMVSYTVTPIKLRATPDGTIDVDPNEVVNIDVSLESDNLSSYNKDYQWSRLDTFEYVSYPPSVVSRRSVYEEQGYHFRNANAFIMPELNITQASNSEAHTTARINTSFPYTTGEVEFTMRVVVLSDTSLVDNIVLRRYVYLKERQEESPFKRSVNFVLDSRNRKRSDILTDRMVYTQADAMGYPKPVIKLFRDCTEVTEPEVRIYEMGTPYRTRNIFQFRNDSDSLTGEYFFRAFSGDKEIAKMEYIEKI